MIKCSECNGGGIVIVLDKAKVHAQTITPPYKDEICEACNGKGEVELKKIESTVEIIISGKPVTVTYTAEKWGEGVKVDFDGGDIENPHNVKIDSFDANYIRRKVNEDANQKLNIN